MDLLVPLAILFAFYFLLSPFLVWALFNRLKNAEQEIKDLHAGIDWLTRKVETFSNTEAAGAPSPQRDAKATPPGNATRQAPARPTVGDTERFTSEPQGSRGNTVPAPTRDMPANPPPAMRPSEREEQVTDDGWSRTTTGRHRDATPLLNEKLKALILGGNTVARVGIVILFFGVAFFLKFAVAQGWLPLEVRLASAVVGGLVMLLIGWRLRDKRRDFSLALQGGGIGIVYLTVFATVSLYGLIAATPGLILMLALVALASALAVLQDARALAVTAAVGGFLAPVLISRDGSHVALFAYYAALDMGILAIAWFKAWRELNLVGFAFTFVIGGMWGHRFYQPAFFASTEPFLVLFFLFYVAVPVLFARRQAPDLKGYVDGTLVFGVPLVAFGLQSRLVQDFEYGLAFSALCAGLFYAALATFLWRRREESSRMLTEAFIALAVAFGTLAIPLAVDGRWTGAAWALEGAALVWIGVRQQRWLARLSGVAVQLGAGAAFISAHALPRGDIPVFNSGCLGALMIALAGLFSAFHLSRSDTSREPARRASIALLAWGLGWWLYAAGNEIRTFLDPAHHEAAGLAFIALSAAGLAWLRRRLDWQDLSQTVLLLLPAMLVFAAYSFSRTPLGHPFAGWGLPAWLLAFFVQYRLLRTQEGEWRKESTRYWHLGTLWLLVFLATWEAAWLARQAVPESHTWRDLMWGLLPATTAVLLPRLVARLAWPLQRFEDLYCRTGTAPLIAFGALWAALASLWPGDPAPLPYVPLVNPLELTQLLVLASALSWLRQHVPLASDSRPWYAWGALAFVVLNGTIARATHYFGAVPFDAFALWHSPQFQAALSIVWTLLALAIMVGATRTRLRSLWLIGSALLGVVVVKLFAVDLKDAGTVARIVSFIGVGLLVLLAGYLSPLPPREAQEEKTS